MKVDAVSYREFVKLPSVLTLSLNRYAYDYKKMDRVKLTDRFTFPLELAL